MVAIVFMSYREGIVIIIVLCYGKNSIGIYFGLAVVENTCVVIQIH